MLSFFRSSVASTLVVGIFGLVLLAMLFTGTGTSSGGLSSIGSWFKEDPNTVAKVGNVVIDKQEVTQIAQNVLESQHRQQPSLTMQTLVSNGVIDKIVDNAMNERALEQFGAAHGMQLSKRQIDAEIEQIPAFAGIDGKFDHAKMLQLIAGTHLTEEQYRTAVAREMTTSNMTFPIKGGAQMPSSVVLAYANLLVEEREGRVVQVPSGAMTTVAKPTEAQIVAYYARHSAQYSIPERRVIEYAVFAKEKFLDAAKPSEVEIAAAYKKDAYKYSAKDLRTVTQVIVPDEAKAKALSDKVRGGASLQAAAKEIGLEAITLASQDRIGFAGIASEAVAANVFKTARGALAPVAKSAFGWHVVRVDAIDHDAGKTLDQARPELTKALALVKIEDVFANFQNTVQNKASQGASFDTLAKANGGAVVTTPAIMLTGQSRDDTTFKAPNELKALLRDAFRTDIKASSDPQLVPVTADRNTVALYHIKQVLASGPLPIAKVHDDVAADAQRESSSKAARVVAMQIVDQTNKSGNLAQAVTTAGIKLPQIDTMRASKLGLAQAQKEIPAPIREMFNVPLHHAKLVEAPNNQGWYVIWLERKTPKDARTQPQFLAQVQGKYGADYGQELAVEFAVAAQAKIGAKKYPSAIHALTASLLGNQSQ